MTRTDAPTPWRRRYRALAKRVKSVAVLQPPCCQPGPMPNGRCNLVSIIGQASDASDDFLSWFGPSDFACAPSKSWIVASG